MRVLRSRNSKIRGPIVRISKTNIILERPVSKLFAVESKDYDTNQIDKPSHKEIASPSPAVLRIVNVREKKTQIKKSEFYFTTSKNRLSWYNG